MSDDLATLVAVCEKAAQSKFPVTIDPAAVLPVVREAATALTEARAEIEAANYAHARMRDRAHAAESELSTLRARAEKAESALAEAVDERDRLRDDIRQLWDFGTEELRVCEHCDAWMTIEEAARVDDVSLCPREAYGSVKFPDEKCFKHRAWIVKEERESGRAFIQQHEGKK